MCACRSTSTLARLYTETLARWSDRGDHPQRRVFIDAVLHKIAREKGLSVLTDVFLTSDRHQGLCDLALCNRKRPTLVLTVVVDAKDDDFEDARARLMLQMAAAAQANAEKGLRPSAYCGVATWADWWVCSHHCCCNCPMAHGLGLTLLIDEHSDPLPLGLCSCVL